MVRARAIRHLDRVRHASDEGKAATATVVDVHAGSKSKASANKEAAGGKTTEASAAKHVAYSVLPDDRAPWRGTVLWDAHDTIQVAGPSNRCVRCDSLDHNIFTCPEGPTT